MNRRRLCLLIAVLFLASLATILVASTVMDPITGLPADLRGKIAFSETGGVSIRGNIGAAQWNEVQALLLRPRPIISPWIRWEPIQTDSYSTARYEYLNGALAPGASPSAGVDWFVAVKTTAGRLRDVLAAGIGSVTDAFAITIRRAAEWFFGLFTWNAAAACSSGSPNDCYWIGGTGSWSQTAHWSDSNGGATCNCAPRNGSNIWLTTSSGAGTITLDVAPPNLGTFSNAQPGLVLAMGTNSLNFAANTITISAGGVTNTSGTIAGGAVTLSGGYYDGSAGASSVAWTSLTMSSTSYIKFGSSGADAISGNVSIGASNYIVFSSGTLTVGGQWTNSSTSASWAVGTSTVVFNSSTAGMVITPATFASAEFYNVTFNSTSGAARTFTLASQPLRWSSTLSVTDASGGTTLDASAAGTGLAGSTVGSLSIGNLGTVLISSVASSWNNFSMTGGTSGTLTLTTAAVAVNGNWDSSGAGSVFTKGTSTVTLAGSGKTVNILGTAGFYGLTISGSYTGAAGLNADANLASNALAMTGSASLTISGNWDTSATTFTKGTSAITLTGAAKTVRTAGAANGFYDLAIAGTISQLSAIDVSDALSTSSTGTLTTSGNNITGGAAVTLAGTGGITGTTASMTVKAVTVGTGTTLSLTTGALNTSNSNVSVTGTLTDVSGSSGFFTLGTGTLTVNNGGVVSANQATVTVSDVTMTGGTSGTITLTSGVWTASGNWNTSGAGSTFTQGMSAITLSGTAKTVRLASAQQFATLTVTGSVTQQTNVTASSLTVSGTLTKTSFTLTFNGLTCTAGSIVDGTTTVTNLTVTDNDATALITVSVFSTWNVNAHYNWTHADSKTTDTITFTIGGNTNGYSYVVTAGGSNLTSGTVAGGNVTFTMSGSASVLMDVLLQNCGGNRYWVGGTGNWSDPTHWSSTSGGASGCGEPTSSVGAVFDANSGAGTATVNLNAAMASLSTSGSTITTIAVGTFNFAVSGNITLASVAVTIGASAGTGLSATGTLTLSGSASINASSGASVVSISGDTAISSAAAFIKFGSGTYTFSGAWSNASTSGSWAAGTGTVIFNAGASKAMVFAALPGSAPEFYNVQFTPSAVATFTMGSNGLVWSNLLILNSSSTLASSGLGLTGGSLTVGNGAALAASSSTVSLTNVSMTGGTSGSITVTSGAWSVSGNWDTSGAGSTFSGGTGTVTMSGSGATVKLATGQQFYILNFTGSSAMAASFLLVSGMSISAGPLDLAGFPLFVNGNLSITGTGSLNFDSGRVTVLGNIVDTSSAANTGSGTLALAATATQSLQGGVWPNIQVVGGEKDFTANLTTLNVNLLGNASVTIRVTAGITWTLTAGGVLSGVSSTARLIMTSSGTWTLNVSGVTGIAQWVAVDHSTATSPGAQGFNSLDSGGNTNWSFPSGAAPLGPWLVLLQHDPLIQISISALGLVSILAVRRYHKKTTTCPVCGHKFTEECHDHE